MAFAVCIVALITATAGLAAAQDDILRNRPRIPRGAKVFVKPMDGFETYLLAALTRKQTPVIVVDSIDQADFVIDGGFDRQMRNWAEHLFLSKSDEDRAAIRVTDRNSGVVAFTYVVEKKDPWKKGQSAAEACAKHLKHYIETGKS